MLDTIFLSASNASMISSGTMPEGTRSYTGNGYNWVGQTTINAFSACSSWVLDHGIIVTSKHCFQLQAFTKSDRSFSSEETAQGFSVSFKIPDYDRWGDLVSFSKRKGNISEIHYDSGDNDIAYILYNPELTKGKVDINHFVSTELPNKNEAMQTVGFPGAGRRAIAKDCKYTNEFGLLEYFHGPLMSTTCKGWFGASGSPVMGELNEEGLYPVYGVLAHSLNQKPTIEDAYDKEIGSGGLMSEYIGRDDVGKYTAIAFSPFSEAQSLLFVRQRLAQLYPDVRNVQSRQPA